MDNDTLINEARHLYAVLHVEQYARSLENKTRFDRLDRLVIFAYCRYQRRLNRCVLCYQYRLTDCIRDFLKKKCRFCPMDIYHSIDPKQ
jgi:hypothetical protein